MTPCAGSAVGDDLWLQPLQGVPRSQRQKSIHSKPRYGESTSSDSVRHIYEALDISIKLKTKTKTTKGPFSFNASQGFAQNCCWACITACFSLCFLLLPVPLSLLDHLHSKLHLKVCFKGNPTCVRKHVLELKI